LYVAAKVSAMAGAVLGRRRVPCHPDGMKLSTLHAVIVGGATAGASAALLLARAGARVTLVERVAEPRAVGAGIGLAENGLAVLESIGLGPAIDHVSTVVGAPRIVDARGRTLLAISGPPPRVRMVRRSDLQRILLDAVAAEPRIETCFGAEVLGSDRTGTVEVTTAGGPRRIAGDLVIGADGVHSRIRAAGDHGVRVRRPGISYVRALVDGELGRGEEAWTPAGLFGSFSLDGSTYLYASAGSRAVRRALAARDLDAFRTAWSDAYPAAREVLAGVLQFEQLLVNDIEVVTCRRWFDGRQVLVGDAAHAMPPNLGQGANSALVDAAVLLDELRRGDDLAAAFAAYQHRRQPAVARVARTSARLGRIAELTNPVGRWLRDRILMPLASRLSSPAQQTTVLQEPAATLLAIGRA
jgi:2-polyprenyl-6-methoxyphenol hydroxylase-like FAD-dependent oxidoreductase